MMNAVSPASWLVSRAPGVGQDHRVVVHVKDHACLGTIPWAVSCRFGLVGMPVPISRN